MSKFSLATLLRLRIQVHAMPLRVHFRDAPRVPARGLRWHHWSWLLGWLFSTGLCAEVRVITEHSPPGEYRDETGRVTGPTVEMVREIMRRRGLSGDIEMQPWKRGYEHALTGPQVALFETARTPARESLFHWVGPIKRIRWGLYATKDHAQPLRSLDEARRANSICAYIGDGKGEYLKQLGFTNLEQPVLSRQCLLMLLRGRVQYWLSSDIEEAALTQAQGLQEEDLVSVLEIDTTDLYIAFSRDTPLSIVRAWQSTLDEMKRDGTLASYYRGTYSESLIDEMSQVDPP